MASALDDTPLHHTPYYDVTILQTKKHFPDLKREEETHTPYGFTLANSNPNLHSDLFFVFDAKHTHNQHGVLKEAHHRRG